MDKNASKRMRYVTHHRNEVLVAILAGAQASGATREDIAACCEWMETGLLPALTKFKERFGNLPEGVLPLALQWVADVFMAEMVQLQ